MTSLTLRTMTSFSHLAQKHNILLGEKKLLASFRCVSTLSKMPLIEDLPQRPRRPINAFLLFLNEHHVSLTKQGIKRSKIGQVWRGLGPEEQQVYIDKYKRLKDEYQLQKQQYFESLSDQQRKRVDDHNACMKKKEIEEMVDYFHSYFHRIPKFQKVFTLKNCANPFLIFYQKQTHDSLKNIIQIGEDWRKLSEDDKKIYKEKYKENKSVYDKEFQKVVKIGLTPEENDNLAEFLSHYKSLKHITKQIIGRENDLTYVGGTTNHFGLFLQMQSKLNHENGKKMSIDYYLTTWKNLPAEEKKHYKKLYDEGRVKYEKDKHTFVNSLPVNLKNNWSGFEKQIFNKYYSTIKVIVKIKKAHDKMKLEESNKPKNVKNSYIYFYSSLKSKDQSVTASESGKKWRNMSDEDKEYYVKMREMDIKKYEKEMVEWESKINENKAFT